MSSVFFFQLKSLKDLVIFMEKLESYQTSHIPNERNYFDLRLCLEELIVNVFQHGKSEDLQNKIEVNVKIVNEPDKIIAEVFDNAKRFNILKNNHVVDTRSGLEDRKIGGLGIHLVKKLSDSLEYVPMNQGNKIILSKNHT